MPFAVIPILLAFTSTRARLFWRPPRRFDQGLGGLPAVV
jgi:hypothetical protein